MHQRLFEITYLLTQRGGLTAGEMAQRFGVSRRTIYRDIDALSAAGIPVYAEKGKGGGIRMLPDFVLDKTMLSREEQAQLVAHFESLASLGIPDTQPVLDKLAAIFGKGGNWLEVDFAPWDGGEEMRATFRSLRDSILRRQVVRFQYTSAAATLPRTVEPARIVFRGQSWYLLGFCRLRQAYRFFKLNRIARLEQTGEEFAPRPEAPPSTDGKPPMPLVNVRLKLAPSGAYRAMDEFLPEQLTPTPDKGYLVDAVFPQGEWLVGYLLSFGAQLQVLSPASLRQTLARELAQMAAHYGGTVHQP